MEDGFRSRRGHGRLALLAALLAFMIAPGAASAGTAVSTAPDLPSGARSGGPVTVGEQGLPGHVVINQSFTGADLEATARLTLIRLSLNCGPGPSPGNPDTEGPAINTPETPCSNPDLGVYGSLGAAGSGSQNCAGISFAITPPNSQGEVDLLPNFPVDLRHGESCVIDFSFGVLRLPSLDTFPGTSGMQTASLSGVRSEILSDPGNPAGIGLKAAAVGSGGAILVQPVGLAVVGGLTTSSPGSPAAPRPSAKLKLKGTCVKNLLKASVSGTGITKVIFKLDGRVLSTVKKAPFKLNTVVKLSAGPHRLTATVFFTSSSPVSEVLTSNFARCRAPNFTG